MQALIITAYRDYDTLKENLKMFSKSFECYVHLDQKSPIATENHVNELNRMEHVNCICKYKINWGSYLHMMAILELLEMAQQNKGNSHFHIISGEDFPVQTPEQFQRFFEEKHPDQNYLEVTDISQIPSMQKRYQIFHFQHIFNRKSKNLCVQFADKVLRNLQYLLPFKRKLEFQYKGLVWCSLTREAVELILQQVRETKIISELKYCEIAEEFIFSNLLLQSELKDKVVWDNLRFDIWDSTHVTGPRYLNMDDYDKIKEQGEVFFVRKVQHGGTPGEVQLYERLRKQFAGEKEEE